MGTSSFLAAYEQDQQGDYQAINSHRFGEGDPQDHIGLHRTAGIRVAGDTLHCPIDQHADPQASPDRSNHGQTSPNQFCSCNFHVNSLTSFVMVSLMSLVVAMALCGLGHEDHRQHTKHEGLDQAYEKFQSQEKRLGEDGHQRPDHEQQHRAGEDIAE